MDCSKGRLSGTIYSSFRWENFSHFPLSVKGGYREASCPTKVFYLPVVRSPEFFMHSSPRCRCITFRVNPRYWDIPWLSWIETIDLYLVAGDESTYFLAYTLKSVSSPRRMVTGNFFLSFKERLPEASFKILPVISL